MLDPRPLNNMLEVFWGSGSRLGVKESRKLREKGKVRFEQRRLWNANEERWHSNYAYNVRDMLFATMRRAGSSGIPELDRMLRQIHRSRAAMIGDAAA